MNVAVAQEADRLEKIAEELLEFARNLRGGAPAPPPEASAPAFPPGAVAPPCPPAIPPPTVTPRNLSEAARYSPKLARLAAIAKAQFETRRNRAEVMPPKLLGEPAWDMVLDLFIHQVAGRKVSITSACIAANVPSTTALRYVYVLESHGLVKRSDDRFDQRRSFLELTEDCFVRVCRYLDKRENILAAATNATIAELGLIVRDSRIET